MQMLCFQVVEGDGLPTMICHKCMTKLSIAWEFKIQCESSDMKLRQLCSENLQITSALDSFTLAIRQDQSLYSEKSDAYTESLNFNEFTVQDSESIVRKLQYIKLI